MSIRQEILYSLILVFISFSALFILTYLLSMPVNLYVLVFISFYILAGPFLSTIHHKNTYFAVLPIPYLGLWLISVIYFTSINVPYTLYICLVSIIPALLTTYMHLFSRMRSMVFNRVPISYFAKTASAITSMVLLFLGLLILGSAPIKLEPSNKATLYVLLSVTYCSFTLTHINSAYRYRLICKTLNTSKVENKMAASFEELLTKFPQKKNKVNMLRYYFLEAIRLFEEGSYEMAFLTAYIIIRDTIVEDPKEYVSDKREGEPPSFSDIRAILVHSRQKYKQIAEIRKKLPGYTLEIIQRAATFIENLVSNKKMVPKREGFASVIANVAKENERFLNRKTKESFEEVVELVNDAIDYVAFFKIEESATHPMIFFASNILMPFSYGILTDLLIGNLPACFYELRIMLESIAKCYIAESHPEENLFFEDKLLSLEEALKEKGVSISKLLKDFGEIIEQDDEPLKLWSKISQSWIHTTGIVSNIVKQVIEKSEPPTYALALPMVYSEADLTTIEELGKQVSSFRKILKTTMDKYKEERITS